jgi:hypothetical protein
MTLEQEEDNSLLGSTQNNWAAVKNTKRRNNNYINSKLIDEINQASHLNPPSQTSVLNIAQNKHHQQLKSASFLCNPQPQPHKLK